MDELSSHVAHAISHAWPISLNLERCIYRQYPAFPITWPMGEGRWKLVLMSIEGGHGGAWHPVLAAVQEQPKTVRNKAFLGTVAHIPPINIPNMVSGLSCGVASIDTKSQVRLVRGRIRASLSFRPLPCHACSSKVPGTYQGSRAPWTTGDGL